MADTTMMAEGDAGLVGPSPESIIREQREDVALALAVMRAERNGLSQVFDPTRDEKSWNAAAALLDNPQAADRDRRQAIRLMEEINKRLDARGIAILQNHTERMKQPPVHAHQTNIHMPAPVREVHPDEREMTTDKIRARVKELAEVHSKQTREKHEKAKKQQQAAVAKAAKPPKE